MQGPTLLRRRLILLPLALHLSEVRPPTPGTSSARLLQLQCTLASLRGRMRSQWPCWGGQASPSPRARNLGTGALTSGMRDPGNGLGSEDRASFYIFWWRYN